MRSDLEFKAKRENETKSTEINKEYDFKNIHTWNILTEEYPKYFTNQLSLAIDERDEKLFLNILSSYRNFTFNWTMKSKNENKYLRSKWILTNLINLIMHYQSAIEKNIIFKIRDHDLIFNSDLTDCFKHEEVYARNVLVQYLHFVIWLSKQRKLTYNIYCGIFSMGDFGSMYMGNNLTMLGSYFAKHYHEGEHYKNGFEDVLTTIEIIFDDYNKGIISEEVNLKAMLSVLNEINDSYTKSIGKQPKSRLVTKRINKVKGEIDALLKSKAP